MNEIMGTIPKEIKSETYLGGGMFFFDIIFIVLFWLIMGELDFLIYPDIQIIYTIVNIVIGIYLTRKTAGNPKKRIFQALVIRCLAAKRNKYHQIGG
ncbi:MAG: DUF5592 family protein [Peptostreptococcaceae bacterium]|nr:DUF5592 family protein [Peptostreptococcaceae bacterium]MDY5739247.1 DUF5592 family protein [Anaerovoracaceae bacterium]